MRVRAAWEHGDLDRRLAEGADPDTDPLLHTRAERLVTPASRAALAAGLERTVAAAHEPGAALSSAAPVRRGPVRGARHELMGLAGELRHMADPRPRRVAMAERLLTEASSVLFTAASSAEVARAARAAIDNLRATPTPTPGAAAEHHFYRPTVAPVPSRPPVDAATW
jgi:hypothetical protein